MKLMLSVAVQAGDEIDNITIGEASATIGRNADNTLVLEDTQRYISGHHAVIDFHAPDYFMTDISTNGVLINDATLPIGNGNNIKLSDGDKIHIAEYTLSVSIADQQQQGDVNSTAIVHEYSDDPFSVLSTDVVQEIIDDNPLMPEHENSSDPFAGLKISEFDDITQDKIESEQGSAPIEQPPAAFKEAFQPFEAEKKEQQTAPDEDIFADDWFKESKPESSAKEELFPQDFFAEKETASEETPEINTVLPLADEVNVEKVDTANSVNIAVKPEKVENPEKPVIVASVDKTDSVKKAEGHAKPEKNEVLSADLQKLMVDKFLQGAGLVNANIGESMTPESFYIIGKIVRASIQGTMDVLVGRAKIKNEMHLDVTMIKSRENNPVKLSVTAEEAIRKLLAPQDAGYLQAEEAVEEAFDDIRAHQVSVISGMQTALLEVLKRFDPQKLEQRLQVQSPLSASIPIHKQAKMWRLFEDLYDDIEREASDNFYHLFGQAFAESYEQQMVELKDSKKDSPFH